MSRHGLLRLMVLLVLGGLTACGATAMRAYAALEHGDREQAFRRLMAMPAEERPVELAGQLAMADLADWIEHPSMQQPRDKARAIQVLIGHFTVTATTMQHLVDSSHVDACARATILRALADRNALNARRRLLAFVHSQLPCERDAAFAVLDPTLPEQAQWLIDAVFADEPSLAAMQRLTVTEVPPPALDRVLAQARRLTHHERAELRRAALLLLASKHADYDLAQQLLNDASSDVRQAAVHAMALADAARARQDLQMLWTGVCVDTGIASAREFCDAQNCRDPLDYLLRHAAASGTCGSQSGVAILGLPQVVRSEQVALLLALGDASSARGEPQSALPLWVAALPAPGAVARLTHIVLSSTEPPLTRALALDGLELTPELEAYLRDALRRCGQESRADDAASATTTQHAVACTTLLRQVPPSLALELALPLRASGQRLVQIAAADAVLRAWSEHFRRGQLLH